MKERKMYLPSLDDMFSTQEERDAEKLEKVVNISLKDIEDFPKHPFKVEVNEAMQEMVNSIKDKGVLVPAIVREKGNGKYEMISGHRRKKASEILNLDTIPCIVRNLTNDEATIIMVDSNLQREKILPSEKAFAYKLKMEALNHQGKKTCRQLGNKLKSVDIIAKDNDDSSRQVHRFLRLTELIPELLKMVDNGALGLSPEMALSPAVSVSYLNKEEQKNLLDIIEFYACTPSTSQANLLRNLSKKNLLTVEKMKDIMSIEKPNQTPKLKVSMNRLRDILPPTLRNDRDREEYVIKAVEFYGRYQKRQREKNHER